MEDLGFGDLVDYSLDTMERIFTTMDELAPLRSPLLSMELEQQLDSMVPPHADSGFVSMIDGSASDMLLGHSFYPTIAGGQILVGFDPEASTSREIQPDEQGLTTSPFFGGLGMDLLT